MCDNPFSKVYRVNWCAFSESYYQYICIRGVFYLQIFHFLENIFSLQDNMSIISFMSNKSTIMTDHNFFRK